MTEDSHSDAGLIFIISGSLIMSQKNNDQYESNASDSVLYTAFAVRNFLFKSSYRCNQFGAIFKVINVLKIKYPNGGVPIS